IRDFHVTGVQTCALPIYAVYIRTEVNTINKDLTKSTGQVDMHVALRPFVDYLVFAHWAKISCSSAKNSSPAFDKMPGASLVISEIGRASCRARRERERRR